MQPHPTDVSDQMRKETSFTIEGQSLSLLLFFFFFLNSPRSPFNLSAANSQQTIEHLRATPSLSSLVYVPRVYPELSSERVLVMEYCNGAKINERERIEAWHFRGGVKGVMDTVLDLFAAMTFEWKFVHADPHP
jgi:hypothetical protein